jgi:amicyanin-dependent methylamine dehydrogenase small subunit
MKSIEEHCETITRQLAMRSSRRGVLARIGMLLATSAIVAPLLPVARGAQRSTPETTPDQSCDYWKYCSVDGFLCSCCGGTSTQCPPGTEPSKVSWIGTCRHAADGKDYLVSYNDCCGVATCGRCLCNGNVGDRPGYSMGVHNDINWCQGNVNSTIYHCTVSIVVGQA